MAADRIRLTMTIDRDQHPELYAHLSQLKSRQIPERLRTLALLGLTGNGQETRSEKASMKTNPPAPSTSPDRPVNVPDLGLGDF